MEPLIQMFRQDTDFQATVEGLNRRLKEQMVAGLSGTARMVYVAALHRETERPILLVTHNLNQAQKAVEDLYELLPREQVLLYPANELVVTEVALAGQETLGERMEVLSRLSRGFTGVLVVPYSGLRRRFPPRSAVRAAHIRLAVGEDHPMEPVVNRLTEIGYERVEMVEKAGEFSVRGGILDVYPVTFDDPVRIEWFDDEVDSIRPFSVADQRSYDKRQEVLIPPARELFAPPERLFQAGDRVAGLLEERLRTVKDPALKKKLTESIGWEIEQLKTGQFFTGIYKYIEPI